MKNQETVYPNSLPKNLEFTIPSTYSKDFILENTGCYKMWDIDALPFDKNGQISIEKLFEVLPIEDFCWGLICRVFTKEQSKWFALDIAKYVLPIYEATHPSDSSVRYRILEAENILTSKFPLNAKDTGIDHDADREIIYNSTGAAFDAAFSVLNAHRAILDVKPIRIAVYDAIESATEACPCPQYNKFVWNWIAPRIESQQ